MVGSGFFSAIFFLMLITLALGSIFGAFETVISAVCDQFIQLRRFKPTIVIATSMGECSMLHFDTNMKVLSNKYIVWTSC